MSSRLNTVWCDVETGGLDPLKSCILQIAAIRLDGQTFTSYVKPHAGADIHPKALEVNGLVSSQLSNFPEASLVADQFLEFLRPQSPKILLAGHNVIKFDRPFLDQFFLRLGKTQAFETMVHYHHLDTLPLGLALLDAGVIKTYNGYMNLESLSKALGVTNTKAHSADGDIKATKECYEAMVQKLRVMKQATEFDPIMDTNLSLR
ncbi:3'-5' exonuclease [Candidatus Woesearchaeota archaeon]|nr:3'-5' exonuclease [Candidatus Woesearchaeota archaeon]